MHVLTNHQKPFSCILVGELSTILDIHQSENGHTVYPITLPLIRGQILYVSTRNLLEIYQILVSRITYVFSTLELIFLLLWRRERQNRPKRYLSHTLLDINLKFNDTDTSKYIGSQIKLLNMHCYFIILALICNIQYSCVSFQFLFN